MEKFEGKYIIIPKVGVDNIKFGMTRGEVREIMRDYELISMRVSQFVESLTDFYDDAFLSFSYDINDKLNQIQVFSSTFTKNLKIFGLDKFFVKVKENSINKLFEVDKDLFSKILGSYFIFYENKLDSITLCSDNYTSQIIINKSI